MEPAVVFVSYAHEDTDVRVRLDTMLKPLVRKGRLEVWADDRIAAGRLWRDEIETSLTRAGVAVLLVSADFLASSYIMDVELPRILERRVPLVCIPVGACRWSDIDALASVQWPLSPFRPINAMTRDERDAALVAASDAVAALVAAQPAGVDNPVPVAAPSHTSQPQAAVAVSPAPGEPGALFCVPPLPAHFLTRDRDLDNLKELLLNADGGQTVGLLGVGGVGKSVLVAAACHDMEVRRVYADGVHWITLGERPDVVAEQRTLARRLGDEATFSTTAEGLVRLRQLFAQRRCLLVVDDVWDADAARAFGVAGASGRVLCTARDRELLTRLGAVVQLVNTLDLPHSVALLERASGTADAADRPIVQRVAAQTRGVPLALALVAGVRRSGRTWPEAALLLDNLDAIFGKHAYADVFKAMRLAIDTLPPGDAQHYRTLAVFPEDVAIPAATVGRYWPVPDAAGTLRRFADRGLLDFDGEHVRFHDLQRTFLQFDADRSQADLHRELLDRHRPAGGWPDLADDDPYLWDHLMYHLTHADEYAELVAVATHGGWLARRLHRDGAYAALADLDQALAVQPDNRAAADARDVLRHWGALFRADLSTAATAATLISRWPPAASGAAGLRGAVWLEPTRPLLKPSAALRRTLTTEFRGVHAIAFDPDGTRLSCAGSGSSVRTWDAGTGLEHDAVTCGDDRFDVVAFDAGRRLAAVVTFADTSAVHLWDVRSGSPLGVLRGQTMRINAVAFSPDAGVVTGAGWDDFLTVWTIDGQRATRIPCSFLGRVWALAFAPGGSKLVAVGDRGACVWDLPSGRERAHYGGHTEMVEQVAFGNADLVASAGRDTSIAVWNARDGSERVVLRGHTKTVTALAFAPDGKCLASAASDGTVRIWDLATAVERAVLTGHSGGVHALAFSPDGRTLATADMAGAVRLWDPTVAVGTADVVSAAGVRKVAFSPDGTRLAVGRSHGHLHLLDWRAGVAVTDLGSTPGAVSGLGFVSGGSAIVVADLTGRLSIRDATSADAAVLLEGYPHAIGNRTIWDLAVTRDGSKVVTGDGLAVRVWDAESAQQIAERGIDGASSVNAIAVTPDGDRVAFGLGWYYGQEVAAGDRLHLWDRATGRIERAVWADRPVLALDWASDGYLLAVAGRDGEVRIHDLRSGTRTASIAASAAQVAFSPDAKTLAAACDDGTVRLWRAADGREAAALRLGTAVSCLAWSRDGTLLAVGFDTSWTVLRVGTG